MDRRNIGIILGGVWLGMFAIAYASVPLYRIFCQKTGYGGTINKAASLPTESTEEYITVQFNSDIYRDTPFTFKPLQHHMRIKIGEVAIAKYKVRNNADYPVKAMATYNVTPFKVASYFHKIECFCFEELTIAPKQEMILPVQFFISADILRDPYVQEVKTITLSYTFMTL